ncbi:MAG: hypothetical protein CVU57_04260 [Deltaproteobacteria bacterium HGW-Deltaproteobacteria-15]|jgi:hypothetical protein|nr:MAG: hypothetical protein CVU57_04260 [Deltaproteobacteria bacterium HGW-Deltaproteobacteria-15]
MLSFDQLKLPIGLAFLFLAAYFLLGWFIRDSNVQKAVAIGAVLGAVGTIGAFFFLWHQSVKLKDTIQLQTETFKLEKRPYLFAYLSKKGNKSVEFDIWKNAEHGAFYGGGDLFFENVGQVPATIGKTQYLVASDELGDTNVVRWFEEAMGKYPDVKTIFPGQQNISVALHPQLGKKPRLVYVGAVIPYTGIKPQEKYWYKFSQLFIVQYRKVPDKEGNLKPAIAVSPHFADHDWDKHSASDPPVLSTPDWNYWLERSHIKQITTSGE